MHFFGMRTIQRRKNWCCLVVEHCTTNALCTLSKWLVFFFVVVVEKWEQNMEVWPFVNIPPNSALYIYVSSWEISSCAVPLGGALVLLIIEILYVRKHTHMHLESHASKSTCTQWLLVLLDKSGLTWGHGVRAHGLPSLWWCSSPHLSSLSHSLSLPFCASTNRYISLLMPQKKQLNWVFFLQSEQLFENSLSYPGARQQKVRCIPGHWRSYFSLWHFLYQ